MQSPSLPKFVVTPVNHNFHPIAEKLIKFKQFAASGNAPILHPQAGQAAPCVADDRVDPFGRAAISPTP
jgi:hypothetical protein